MRNWQFKILNITLLSLLFGGLFLLRQQAFAAVRCETQYGGGEVCVRTGNLQINKKVLNPDNGLFVDNLADVNDHQFTPGVEVTFRLIIKNVGDATFDTVHVTDTLPSFLELSSGDLSFDISSLEAGQTVERDIRAKVISADKFPNDKTLLCDVNTAEVSGSDQHDKDTTRLCAQKSVLGVSTPVTGPENWFVILSFSLLTGLTGFSLLKFSRKDLAR